MSPDRDEPLRESAALAWRLAPRHCKPFAPGTADCSWNHAVRPTLRMLGCITSQAAHFDVYRRAFASLPAAPRIMVTGAADCGMLNRLLHALGERAGSAEITVNDLCQTPLELNLWYAQRLGIEIRTRCADSLRLEGTQLYDAACTHAFLGEFAPPDRARLLAVWHRLLRPGGRLATVQRIRQGARPDERVGFSAAQAREFVQGVVRAAASFDGALPMSAAELERAAARYAAELASWPVVSMDYLRGLFEEAGFALEELSGARMAGRAAASAPTTPSSAEYAFIIAVRR
jgi:SAM-dependent methyltransferase